MTKRSILVMSSCSLALVAAWSGAGSHDVVASPAASRVAGGRSRAAPASPRSGVAIGSSFVIEPPMADYRSELDQREEREQIRDWAVLGTLTRLGATSQQLASATYQTPPARLPYLDELYAFDVGRGRRAYLGNRVLLFHDSDDPDPQATIGRLADRVRMENGEVPRVVEHYVVDDQRDHGAIRVTRAPDLTREQLFSNAYGYVVGEVTTPEELSAWLDRIDDLTFARLDIRGQLQLGGRRFAGTPTANLTIDDVAALYHAQKQLEQRRIDAVAELLALPPIVGADLARYFGLSIYGAPRERALGAYRAFDANLAVLPSSMRNRVHRALATAFDNSASPGFSLDPEWLPDLEHPGHPLMLARIRAFAEDPCADLQRTAARATVLARQEPDESRRTSRTALAELIQEELPPDGRLPRGLCDRLRARVAPALHELSAELDNLAPEEWEAGFARYYQLVHAWRRQTDGSLDGELSALAARELAFHENDTRVQCGRYEGLAGTRAGMTLFYTDLLAKVWESTDFGRTAPFVAVPGFLSQPQLDVSAAFRQEAIDRPGTRVWFGSRPSGVSRSQNDHEVSFAFDHRFTRIYSAGHDPADPGHEEQPDEGSRRSLGWWDRHFDDVADYEPEYHRQNQIMKWALVTAILPGTSLGDALREREVFHDYRFADFQRSHHRVLRFAERLPQVQQGIRGKECLPLLSSYSFNAYGDGSWWISGGVSTVGRAAPEAVAAVDAAKPLGARVAPVADLGAGTSGTATRAQAALQGETVTFRDAAVARTRTVNGDVAIGTPRVTYAEGSTRGTVAIRAGEGKTAIGEVGADRAAGKVGLRWTEGPVERARLGKPEAPTTLEAADQAARSGRAVDAAKVYEQAAPRAAPTADRLAREAVVDIAHRRPAAVQAKLRELATQGKQVSPEARDALLGALRRESAPVAGRVEAAMRTGAPLEDAGTRVIVERGHVILTRDVVQLPRASVPAPTANLSKSLVYIDEALRVGREGLLPDTGGTAARWLHQPGVKLVELRTDTIGALPDRFVETSTGMTLERVPGPMPVFPPGMPPPVFVLQKCDAQHKTATTGDDC